MAPKKSLQGISAGRTVRRSSGVMAYGRRGDGPGPNAPAATNGSLWRRRSRSLPLACRGLSDNPPASSPCSPSSSTGRCPRSRWCRSSPSNRCPSARPHRRTFIPMLTMHCGSPFDALARCPLPSAGCGGKGSCCRAERAFRLQPLSRPVVAARAPSRPLPSAGVGACPDGRPDRAFVWRVAWTLPSG